MVSFLFKKATEKIKYLKHTQIDKSKWDKCITRSSNFKIFAYSWWLDVVSPGWDALVLDNYKAVMPLTWEKRYSMAYLIQPLFSQQLGIFSTDNLNYTNQFFKSIPYKFLYAKICITNEMQSGRKPAGKARANFVLPLKNSYENLYNNYSKSTKKNIKKAINRNVSIANCRKEESIEFFKEEYYQLLTIPKEKFDVLNHILTNGALHGELKCFGAFENNTMLASACCLLANKHIYMIMVASPEGKEKRALFLLLDEMIRNYSSQNVILDFGGSDVESIAYVFSGFGAKKETYFEFSFSPVFV